MKTKNLRRTLSLAAFLLVCMACMGGVPRVSVKVILLPVSADSTVLLPGDKADSDLNAPLRAQFVSELITDDGKEYVMFPQWTVTRTVVEKGVSATKDYLKRQEQVTEFEFNDNGQFEVRFAWSYREKDSTSTIPGDEIQPMVFTVDDSELRLYNAFSPNGDGINDVYKIYVRSIVSMKIAIFNRWGQTIKSVSGPIDSILPSDAEPDNDGGFLFEIWDGKYHGSIVDDGVYFINVQATGAGGRKYEKRQDINVLKGLGTQH